jgi:hypothetical protein
MTKPARFPCRIDTWMSQQLAATCEMVAERQEITASAVIRQALTFYFAQIGALAPLPPARPNGQHHQERANNAF